MRKLRLTGDEIKAQTAKIIEMLQTGATTGKINFSLDIGKLEKPPEEKKAKVIFTPKAFLKMTSLVAEWTSEIAWHFLAKRDPDDPVGFILYDVIVYPQKVTGATVEMDEAEYNKWQLGFSDEEFNHIRGQGHSHVNMSVGPSTTDIDHQEKIVCQLNESSENPFYIFVIINKRHEIHFDVYDVENNIVYENNDVTYYVYDQDVDLIGFINDSKDLVKKYQAPKATANTPKKYSGAYTGEKNWERWNRSFYDGNDFL